MYVYLYTCMHACSIYVCMHVGKDPYVHMYVGYHAQVCLCMCMSIYMCVCM